jgi:hypothetical protein
VIKTHRRPWPNCQNRDFECNGLLTTAGLHFTASMEGGSRADKIEAHPHPNGPAAFLLWRSLPSDRVSETREERQYESDRLHPNAR